MNKLLKMRIWDGAQFLFCDLGKHLHLLEISERGTPFIPLVLNYPEINDGTFVVQHFAGVKDKKGKEIYEGDILTGSYQSDTDVKSNNKLVIFEDGAFKFVIRSDWVITLKFLLNKSEINRLKLRVIGNKFENPELLKSKIG